MATKGQEREVIVGPVANLDIKPEIVGIIKEKVNSECKEQKRKGQDSGKALSQGYGKEPRAKRDKPMTKYIRNNRMDNTNRCAFDRNNKIQVGKSRN